MSTIKQKKVAKLIIDNFEGKKKLTGQKMLENAGYGKGVAKTSGRVINSTGVKNALKDYGFNEEAAKREVGKILMAGKEENRLKAAAEIFKVLGSYKKEVTPININPYQINDDQLKRILDR
jgi:hypothetical protein